MTSLERQVLDVLRAGLAHRTGLPAETVGAETVLLDTGLQSIDAVLLCAEVEETFGREVDLEMIFDHETLGSLAAALAERFGTA